MTVEELIEKLKKMPHDKKVEFFGADNHFYSTYNVVDYCEDTVVIVENKYTEKYL